MKQLVFGLVALGGAVGPGLGDEPERPPSKGKGDRVVLKAVVHLNFADSERQRQGLKNVANILKGAKQAEIVVVCHGGGIGLLVKDQSRHATEVARLARKGVRFAACENTMRDRSISRDALLPDVATVPSGAVEILRKQQQGYGYFKP